MHYETIFTSSDHTRIAFQTSLRTAAQAEHDNGDSSSSSLAAAAAAQSNPLASKCILLMHGFSGSSEYFVRNHPTLSQQAWVVAPDMRGHGRSQQTKGGYHVARLAADLLDLVRFIRSVRSDVKIYPVGCSIGAAVLWTYVEIFGNNCAASFAAGRNSTIASNSELSDAINSSVSQRQREPKDFEGMVFVDQAPLQDRSNYDKWDETQSHYGLFDEETLHEAQSTWGSSDLAIRQEGYKGLVASCLGYRAYPLNPNRNNEDEDKEKEQIVSAEQSERDEKFFSDISAQCDGVWLAKLMADHTRYDHREAIETINVPVLVMAGKKSGCFPLAGMLETVTRVNHGGDGGDDNHNKSERSRMLANASIFECGHWLFYEEPERFNREILDFITSK